MKRYLIKLSQPVIVDDSTEEEKKQATIYGFLGPVVDEDKEPADYLVYDINSYVDYLAAMDERNTVSEKEFDAEKDNNLIGWSQRISEIGRNYREKIGLTFTISTIDLERIEGDCLICGLDSSIIICDSLMDSLTRLAEQQAEEEKKEQHNVVLFNRPIWLPNNILWEGEDGFCHIYGLVLDEDIDRKLLETCNLYLGYLAMIEEVTLNDVTPSGYTSDVKEDGVLWYDRGKGYPCVSDKIKKECNICRHKNNLKLRGAVVHIPQEDIEDCVKDGYILSQWLYEHLIEIVANAKEATGCQNENPASPNEAPLLIDNPPFKCPKC